MPVDLDALLDPSRAALLMMECQEGIVGGGGRLGALAEAVARHGTVANIARPLAAARPARRPAFPCTVAAPADGGGAVVNCPLLAPTTRGEPPSPGSPP